MNTSNSRKKSFTEELKGSVSDIIKQVRKLIKEGNARRLVIENKKGKVLFQTQLTAGIAGTALVTAMAPIISAITMFALFMNDIKIIVEKYPEEELGEDEYEVEAEAEVIVDIKDEDEDENKTEKDEAKKASDSDEDTEKTVGKKIDEDIDQ